MADKRPILLVEDTMIQKVVLTQLLSSGGMEVECVDNAEEALKWFESHLARPVLTDVSMPGMDGYELCRRLKKEESFKDVPVILLESLRTNNDLLKMVMSGADGFVYKEFEEDYFIPIIHALLDQFASHSNNGQFDVTIAGSQLSASARQLSGFLMCAFNTAVYCRIKYDKEFSNNDD